jgi:hypothetical protein
MRPWLVVLMLVACGGDSEPAPARALGMNDVSMLLPLPPTLAVPTLSTIRGLVPENLVASLVFANTIGPKNGAPVAYDDFQIVALRFDICSRDTVGDCPDGEDGRLRLVFQPVHALGTHDMALHAFYPIPHAELPAVVAELRALAQLHTPESLLDLNEGSPAYLARLKALVDRYASAATLVKITVIGQDINSAAFAWIFGGLQRGADGVFTAIPIPRLGERTRQHVLVAGGDTVFHVEPGIDSPPGFSLSLDGFTFQGLSPTSQRFTLETLAAIQNPRKHDAADLMCVTCHVATFLTTSRARTAGIDPDMLADRFTSAYDTHVDTVANRDARVIRAFGYAGSQPVISQRVANDTAHVLEEIERRYPTTTR